MINRNLFLALVLIFISKNASSALALDATRYIYNGDSQFISAMVNNDAEDDYGAQLWVENIIENDTKPTFIATPSFFRVSGNSRQVFRIMKVSDHMPEDKESIYWLNLQEIPKSRKGSGISMAIRTRVKLIYRPASVAKGRPGAESRLTMEYLPGEQWLVNSTPYIFAIGSILDEKDNPIILSVGDRDKLTMFMPGDKVNVTGSVVRSVNALNDYGSLETYKLEEK